MRGDVKIVSGRIAAVPVAEEVAQHILMGRKMAEGSELQPVQHHVVAVEIDHIDAGGLAGKIGQHVAAAGTDGDDAVTGRQRHGLHVHFRVFPDLRINEAGKEKPEQPLGNALWRKRAVAQHGFSQFVPVRLR